MDKLYCGITEAAKEVGVSVATLRFWEKEIPQLKPMKTPGGTRRYTQKDIDVAKSIKTLTVDLNYTLDGVRKQLSNRFDEMDMRVKLTERLEKIRRELVAIRLEMNGIDALGDEVVIESNSEEIK